MSSPGDSDARTRVTPPRSAAIWSARDQVEAARRRQQRLSPPTDAPRAAPEPPPAADAIPGYRLLGELHRGGQGVVYLAVQESTDRRVAVKLLRQGPLLGAAPVGLARFEREIDALSRLKHPNIVTIFDCGRRGDYVFIVMDYVDGLPLDMIARVDNLPLHELLEVFARVCDGVNAAHLRGVIHRDLKPANILVDGRSQPHVLDFGLAKLTDDSADAQLTAGMTATGQFVGSLPWASPEQAEGRTDQLDIRTDVYSLGVVLFQVLTGAFPYAVTGRLAEIVRRIVEAPPVRPSTLRGDIDRELETIVLKCLAKEPDRRYQNAGELARDLRRYLAGEPIEARRDSLRYVMAKRLARYRLVVATAAILLLAVLTGLAVCLAFWRQAEHERGQAEQSATAARQSTERADQEAAQSRAVVNFMREVLTSVDPDKNGADVRLVQVLAEASRAVPERFAAHPQQAAEVRELLGDVYFKLALWSESHAEFSAAADLWREHAGPDDSRTLQAEFDQLGAALNLHRYREGEAAARALHARMERVLGADDRRTLGVRRAIAIAMISQGRVEEAAAILDELRAHPALADDQAMQIRLAITTIEVLQWRRAFLPDGPQRRAILEEEHTLARDWIWRSEREHGGDHTLTLQGRVVLAGILVDRGEFEDAAQHCRDLLASSEDRLPDCYDVRSLAFSYLAASMAELGALDEAVDYYIRRIECLRTNGASAKIALLSAITDALGYFDRAERGVEGEQYARELAERVREFSGEMRLSAEAQAASFASMQGRIDDAETAFAELLAKEGEFSDDRARGRLHMLYGRHLIRAGRLADAEHALRRAAACVGDLRRGTHDAHPDDVIWAFVSLYEAWGRQDDAREYRDMLTRE